ncbi:hypothetical protein KOI65_17385, partial [Escherichia coli]|nr:hypothetical protein [Escherichia coli]MBY8702201.1 hypothetical protein [Escherichia coli]
GSFAAFWLHNNKGRLTRGCNPTSSKFIHTWLRFGEIMRGSLRTKHQYQNQRRKKIKYLSLINLYHKSSSEEQSRESF